MSSRVSDEIMCEIKKTLNQIMEDDCEFLRKNGFLMPKVFGFGYCPECGKIVVALSLVETENEDIYRKIFPLIVANMIQASMKCRACGSDALPIGYAQTSTAWMLNVEKYSEEEVEAYYSAVSTIKRHPKKVEVYIAALITVLGNEVSMKRVERRKGRVVGLRDVELPKATDVSGNMVLPLPKYDVDEAVRRIREEHQPPSQ